jgi:hypothetical protein
MQVVKSVRIAARREHIWEVLSDVTRWSEWTESITDIRFFGADSLALGNRVEIRQPRIPRAIWCVTKFRPPEGFTWESHAHGAHTVGKHWIKIDNDGIHCVVVLTLEQTGLVAAVMRPFMIKRVRAYLDMEAEGLKKRCEGLPGN